MYQEWLKLYEDIKNKSSKQTCPKCGRKLGDDKR